MWGHCCYHHFHQVWGAETASPRQVKFLDYPPLRGVTWTCHCLLNHLQTSFLDHPAIPFCGIVFLSLDLYLAPLSLAVLGSSYALDLQHCVVDSGSRCAMSLGQDSSQIASSSLKSWHSSEQEVVLGLYCHQVPCCHGGVVWNQGQEGQEVAARLSHLLGHCSCSSSVNQTEFFSSLKVWQIFFQALEMLKASLAL